MFKKIMRLMTTLFVLFLFLFGGNIAIAGLLPEERPLLAQEYGALPLFFIPNMGQVDPKIKYIEKGQHRTTHFTREGVSLYLSGGRSAFTRSESTSSQVTALIKLTPLGANVDPVIVSENRQPGRVNVFVGDDPRKWHSNLSTYRALKYENVYKGIDIRFYGNNRQLEYDVILQPGADPNVVQFAYEGVEGLELTNTGDLEILLKEGKLTQKKPYIYQEIEGKRVEVEGIFKLNTSNPARRKQDNKQTIHQFGFEVASYNPKYVLVIDPVLDYSSYLGGANASDSGVDIAVDREGNAYVLGSTLSSDFPTQSPFQSALSGESDVFITKINPSGTALIYATFLGGGNADTASGIAVDASGNVFITGVTSSTNFPTLLPIQAIAPKGSNAFVSKLNATGSQLLYSTYLGGDAFDRAGDIAIDPGGNAFITGETNSLNFPTTVSAIQKNHTTPDGFFDAFVSKINPAGSALVYSTYLGGTGNDYARGIVVDWAGNAVVAGETSSTNFPTAAPLKAGYNGGNTDLFISKINEAGTELIFSTYFGGSEGEELGGIATDSGGNVYLTGRTLSGNFPTFFPIQAKKKENWDLFVSKIRFNGASLLYSTYLGGNALEKGHAIAVDPEGNAYLVGESSSSDFPVLNAIQGSYGGGASDIVLVKINANGDQLLYATYLGGSQRDVAYGITVDRFGSVYMTGETRSLNFPVVSRPIQAYSGQGDGFVAKISDPRPGPNITVTDSIVPIDDLLIPFGNVETGMTATQVVTIKNEGDSNLEIGTIAAANPLTVPFSLLNDTCSQQKILPLASCTFHLRFSPDSIIFFQDLFDIPSNDPDENPVMINVSGTGTGVSVPDITLSEQFIDFGSITMGTSSTRKLTISNDGSAPLTIESLDASGSLERPFFIESDLCTGKTLPPSSECRVDIRFSPTAALDSNARFEIRSNDPDENRVNIDLQGRGLSLPVPDIFVSDTVAPLDDHQVPFGIIGIGTISVQRVTVKNVGNANLVLENIARSNPLVSPFSIPEDHCSAKILLPNESCFFDIQFSPTQAGNVIDSFDISSNDPDDTDRVITIDVNGQGSSSPQSDILVIDSVLPETDLEMPFGEIISGRSVAQTVTLSNTGNAPLNIGTIAQSNSLDAPFSLHNDACSGQTLGFLETCAFDIQFSPTTTGDFEDRFDIPSNDPNENPVSFNVSGAGLQSIVNNPPSKPVLLSPANGETGVSNNLSFQWEPSIDPEGDIVTYTLFVCEDPNPFVCAPTLEASFQKIKHSTSISFGLGFVLIGFIFLRGRGPAHRKRLGLFILGLMITTSFLISCHSGDDNPSRAGSRPNIDETVVGLQSGTQYFWIVVAKDSLGAEVQSDVWHFTTR